MFFFAYPEFLSISPVMSSVIAFLYSVFLASTSDTQVRINLNMGNLMWNYNILMVHTASLLLPFQETVLVGFFKLKPSSATEEELCQPSQK